MNDLSYNGIRLSNLDFFLEEYPVIPAAVRATKQHSVPDGGNFLEDLGYYEPTEIEVKVNYKGEWGERWRELQKILSAKDAKLVFENDPDVYYRILSAQADKNQCEISQIGRCTVKFVTKDGLAYLRSGTAWRNCPDTLFNHCLPSLPKFRINGSGVFELNVNGNEFSFFCDKETVIDVEKELVWQDNEIRNRIARGDISKLCLKSGANEIHYPENFRVEIQPNWREL